MARYRVGFDGRWQGKFDAEADAIAWASEVGETGRTAFVAQWRFPRRAVLVAVFPPSQEAAARERWRLRGDGPERGGGGWPMGGF